MQESWSKKYKKSIDCGNPKGFSQKAHCAARKKRKSGEETQSKSPFSEDVKGVKFSKFSHKTQHLKGKQHQLDPNLDLKQLVHHATVQYVDRDADGDVDVYDNPKKGTPDENPTRGDVGDLSKKLIKKQKGELKHTKRGMAYEDLRRWFGSGDEGGVGGGGWDEYNTKGERTGKCARGENDDGKGPKPKCLSKEKAAKMTKSEIASAVKRKRREDPVADRPGKGGKPIMSSNKIDEAGDWWHPDPKKDRAISGIGNKMRARQDRGQDTSAQTKPDYSRRLKPGESYMQFAKRKEAERMRKEEAEKRYCMKCKKIETRNECSYGPEMWDKMTVGNFSKPVGPFNEDQEYSMARSELATIEKAAKRLKKKLKKGEGNLEAWVQSKITKAADYIDTAADYVDSGEMEEENNPCWTGYKKVGMKKKGDKLVPNCVPVSEDIKLVDKILLEMEWNSLNEENKPTNPKLWAKWKSKAKAKFDVYPSAYANGWAAKGYKSEGGGWKSVKEETIEDLNGNTFAEVIDLIKPDPIKVKESVVDDDMYGEFAGEVCPYCGCDPCECEGRDDEELDESARVQSRNGQLISVIVLWRGKTYATRIFFPQLKLPNRSEVTDQIQKIYPDCKVVYYKSVDMEPGQPFLYVSEDWQKVNRKDKTDGLSQKAVNAYRRENPGSKLQTAVTEKKPTGKRAQRRKNFCSRMSGMKKRLTSAETARDPDSRINKALRRWRCN